VLFAIGKGIIIFYYSPIRSRIFYLTMLIFSVLCIFYPFRIASFRRFCTGCGWKNVLEKFGYLWIIPFLCNTTGQLSTVSGFR